MDLSPLFRAATRVAVQGLVSGEVSHCATPLPSNLSPNLALKDISSRGEGFVGQLIRDVVADLLSPCVPPCNQMVAPFVIQSGRIINRRLIRYYVCLAGQQIARRQGELEDDGSDGIV
jgi:hypothetical protein